MAGWLKIAEDQCRETLIGKEFELQSYFVELLSRFLNTSTGVSDCFRPVPPRLGNGHFVDLLKLYFVVKQKGGFESISEKNMWGDVCLQCGLDSSFRTTFKLIYTKYLDSFESWLVKLDEQNALERKLLTELERDYTDYVSNYSNIVDVKNRNDDSSSLNLENSDNTVIDLTSDDDENDCKELAWKKIEVEFADQEGSTEGNDESAKSKYNVKICLGDVGDSTEMNAKVLRDDSLDVGSNSIIVTPIIPKTKQSDIIMDSVSGVSEETRGCENLKQVKCKMSSVDGIYSYGSGNMFSPSTIVADDVVKSSENSVFSEKCSIKNDDEEMMNVDSGVSKEVSSQKRKRDSFSGLLEWMANVAKDPTDPAIGDILECSKRPSRRNGNSRKQTLLPRESLFLLKIRAHRAKQFGREKRQKIQPSKLDKCENMAKSSSFHDEVKHVHQRQQSEAQVDSKPTISICHVPPMQQSEVRLDTKPTYSICPVRERQRSEVQHDSKPTDSICPAPQRQRPEAQLARLDSKPTASICIIRSRQRINAGKAEVQEWTGVATESNSKWLGTSIWLLKKTENTLWIEKDPIGQGRAKNCECLFPGSTGCVKLHVAGRRMKLRSELGCAFYAWKFDKMGEECGACWTNEEEKKFRRVVRENMQRGLWEPLCKALPQKRWVDQVNYYYNVYMLRRRGYQNRHNPNDIDSDDDETVHRSTNNSIRDRVSA